MKTKKEVAKEWKTTGGTCEVNSAGRIDQLGALRFKMKSESPIYSWESGGISENDIPGNAERNSERRNVQ